MCSVNKIVTSQNNTDIDFYAFVESASNSEIKCDYILQRTRASFLKTPRIDDGQSPEADRRNIRNWTALMVAKGSTLLTLKRYLGKLHTLYTAYRPGDSHTEALFSELREKIADPTLYPDDTTLPIPSLVYRLPEKIHRLAETEKTDAYALLYLLYSGGAPFSRVTELKFNEADNGIEQLREIIDHMPRERRSYVFPLGHGVRRTGQVSRQIGTRMGRLLTDLGYRVTGALTPEIIRGWWVDAALNCGIAPEKIAGMFGAVPAARRWLELVEPIPLDEAARVAILRQVADSLNSVSPRWYAMFLRDRNTPDDIRDRLRQQKPKLLREVHFFYPTRLIVTREGKKKIRREIPYIPKILFFRARPDRIQPLFSEIGDLAWCFRTTAAPGAPYAVISRRDMEIFQKMIGVVDSSLKVEYRQNPDLQPERRVRITGGDFKGYEGTIYKQAGTKTSETGNNPGNKTEGNETESAMRTFLLRINDANNIIWQVKIEEAFLQPL